MRFSQRLFCSGCIFTDLHSLEARGKVQFSLIISFGIRLFEGILTIWANAVKLANAPCSFYFSTT